MAPTTREKLSAPEEENTEEQKERDKLKTMESLEKECDDILSTDLFSAATVRAYKEDIRKLMDDLNLEWLKGYPVFMRDTLEQAKAYKSEFESILNKAVKDESIGTGTKEGYIKKFKRSDWLEFQRKEWLDEKNTAGFHKSLGRREEAAQKRKALQQRTEEKKLQAADAPSLKYIKSVDAFNEKDIETKEDIVKEASQEVITAAQKREMILSHVSYVIAEHAAGSGRCIGEAERDELLSALRESKDPLIWMKEHCMPQLERAARVRHRFDALRREAPSAVSVLSVDAWIKLEKAEREEYLTDMRMKIVIEKEKEERSKTEHDRLLSAVRASIASDDAARASLFLKNLERHPLAKPSELATLREEIRLMLTKPENERTTRTDEARRELDAIASGIHGGVRTIYTTALAGGESAFSKLEKHLKSQLEPVSHSSAHIETHPPETIDSAKEDGERALSEDDQILASRTILTEEDPTPTPALAPAAVIRSLMDHTHPRIRRSLHVLTVENERWKTQTAARPKIKAGLNN